MSRDGAYTTTQGKSGNISDRPYFSGVMKGDSVISSPLISKSTGKNIIVIATPINNGAGILAGTLTLDQLSDTINSEKFGISGYAFMIDGDGQVIAHPNHDYVLKRNLLKDKSASMVSIARKMTEGKSGTGIYEFEGTEKMIAYAPLKSTGWSIGVTAPKSELYSELNMVRAIEAILVLVIIFLVFLIWKIVGRSIQPLVNMAQLTKQIEDGNLKLNMNSSTDGDEIGALSISFNQMIAGMRDLISSILDTGKRVNSLSSEMVIATDEANNVVGQVSENISELARGTTSQSDLVNEGSGRLDDPAFREDTGIRRRRN